MFKANHYVQLNGQLYMAGEIISDDIAKDQEKWLLSVGAITPVDAKNDVPEVYVMDGLVTEDAPPAKKKTSGRAKK